MTVHQCQDLIYLFNKLFKDSEKTILVGNGIEPLYLPSDATNAYHQVIFTQDYFASALHEIAHWCIAGTARRKLKDYGYWYMPDGRNEEQQALFASVEVKPQALECIFSMTAGSPFIVSQDNLNGTETDNNAFEALIRAQVQTYLTSGLPERARQFNQALAEFYITEFQTTYLFGNK